MDLHFYNTLTRHLDKFVPMHPGQAGLYSCGPTVYGYAHIGNLRTYIFVDLLKRALVYNGYQVKHVMNVTDVGHLTSDADNGEDKIQMAAGKEHKSAWEISRLYEEAFISDIAKLGILPPHVWCRATDHIKGQVDLVEKLEAKGFTYRTKDGIYYDTSKFKDYGRLAQQNLTELKPGARVDIGDKKSPTDFALWKFSPQDKKRDMEWPSPWGMGFPGWHIECSAMSMEYLGETFDIHTGGIDHIPIHHTNEIAQSEPTTGKRFVNYWMHANFLVLRKEKMAKSSGLVFTLKSLLDAGFEATAYRYLCLTVHYRSELEFSWESLHSAASALANLRSRIRDIKKNAGRDKTDANNVALFEDKFKEIIHSDLDIPRGLAFLWETLKNSVLSNSEKYALTMSMDRVFGLNLEAIPEEGELPDEVKKLINEREQARARKEWKKSDEIRAEIKGFGYQIKDTPEGTQCEEVDIT